MGAPSRTNHRVLYMKHLLSLILILAVLSFTNPVLAATDVKNDDTLGSALVSYWKLEESSGSRLAASSTNDLTANGAPGNAAAIQGNGVDLESGSSQYLSIADGSQTGLDFSDVLSFACWFKFETLPSAFQMPLITKRIGAGNNRSYFWALDDSASVKKFNMLWYTNGSTVGGNLLSDSWSPSTATWYHIGVTKNGTSVKFYVDGAQHGATKTGTNGTVYNGTAAFELGAFTDDPRYFDGVIDECGVWSRELTSGEMSELYNSGTGIPYEAAAVVPTTPIGTPKHSVSGGQTTINGSTIIIQ